jgi:hypothetical protein
LVPQLAGTSTFEGEPGLANGARARIDLPWDGADRALSIAATLGLVALVAGSIWAWPNLPPVIPIEFGFGGQPVGWGHRAYLLLLPIIGGALYGLLTVVARVPHVYNYPWPITAQNAARQYLLARRLILAVRVVVVLVFLALLVGTTMVALGRSIGLGPWWLPALLSCVVITLAWYLAAANRAR